MTDDPEVLSLAEFARRIERTDSWVAQLKRAGRLALTAEGRVRVRESLEMIESTAAGNVGASERHAAAREAKAEAATPDATAAMRREAAQAALRLRAAQAARAELDLAKASGELWSREEAQFVIDALATTTRVRVMQIPDTVASSVFGAESVDEVVAVLDRECRRALTDIASELRKRKESLVHAAKATGQ